MRKLAALGGGALLLAGCQRYHSMFSTANGRAYDVALLGAVALVGFTVVGLVMWGVLVWATARKRGTFAEHAPHDLDDGKGWVVAFGIAIPGLSFLVLLVWSLLQMGAHHAAHEMHEMRPDVKIIGHRWWWEIQYLGAGPSDIATSANELHIPTGRPVHVQLESADVIHSFWVPALGGKTDLTPGHTTGITLEADLPGEFFGQCAEFCGSQHANMRLVVIAHSPDEYDKWLANERRPAAVPATPEEIKGKQVFESMPCADCHQIRGSRAHGRMGPDLTHVGGRTTIAAAAYPNTRAYLDAWVVHAQELKPDSQMPDITALTGDDMQALTDYLEALR